MSGPAAGLTVIVAGVVDQFGWRATCAITVAAGVLQMALGVSRVARAALAISPTVVHAMLAGIGVTLALGQLHVLLGGGPNTGAVRNLVELPGQLARTHLPAALVGLRVIAILLGWPRLPEPVRRMPGPLVAVVVDRVGRGALAAVWPASTCPVRWLRRAAAQPAAGRGRRPRGRRRAHAGRGGQPREPACRPWRSTSCGPGPPRRPRPRAAGQGAANRLSGLLGGCR